MWAEFTLDTRIRFLIISGAAGTHLRNIRRRIMIIPALLGGLTGGFVGIVCVGRVLLWPLIGGVVTLMISATTESGADARGGIFKINFFFFFFVGGRLGVWAVVRFGGGVISLRVRPWGSRCAP